MKYKAGQWVTLRGEIVGTAEFTDRDRGRSCKLAIDLAGPTKREVISVDAACARLVELDKEAGPVPKLRPGLVTPDVIYAACLRLGFLDAKQVPWLWRNLALDLVREMDELDKEERKT